MGLFEDVSQFLESRLDEFLQAHPELELQALDDQLQQQETDTQRLIQKTQQEEQSHKMEILRLAEEIKTWHFRVEKAQAANRPDLARQAQEREASLLREGNQRWGQMKGSQERQQDMTRLLNQIQVKRQELQQQQAKLRQQKQQTPPVNSESWGTPKSTEAQWSELERQFRNLELDLEMRDLKKKQQ